MFGVTLLLSFFGLIAGDKLSMHTFEPPYKEVDGKGDRSLPFCLSLLSLFDSFLFF
jgi:hypothetical protein